MLMLAALYRIEEVSGAPTCETPSINPKRTSIDLEHLSLFLWTVIGA